MSEDPLYERRRFDLDHDLIVEMHTMIKAMRTTISDHIDQDKSDFNDVHKRITDVSKYIWMGAGAIAAIQVVLSLFKYYR